MRKHRLLSIITLLLNSVGTPRTSVNRSVAVGLGVFAGMIAGVLITSAVIIAW